MEIALLLAVFATLVLMLLRRKFYKISLSKTAIILVLLAVMGLLSTNLMFLIENGKWGGRSIFGGVVFIPIIFWPIAKVLRVRVPAMMDFIAPPGVIMFAVMKIDCYFSGCCGGRVIRIGENGIGVCFPSQIVEGVATMLLVAILLWFEYKGKTTDILCPLHLITYGVLRFGLNFMREPQEPFLFGLQAGAFWSIVVVLLGSLWLLLRYYKKVDKQYQEFISQQQK